ncbi:FG-GAP repeat domain-containing protein [Streptomyces boluensis]|uniref:Integrin-like protein n=1 Tax=Streptomyces boluensis TaxID=1775135 RepID=A0A964UQP6_9ACTN|nr:hypothetical protein [Streptomyces boluensis]
MTSRTALSALSVCAISALLVPLTGCGGDTSGDTGGGKSGAEPTAPGASAAPSAGKGSKDPDDINGDGFQDLLVPVYLGKADQPGADQRVAVVYGSADGLDPTTRTVHGRAALGLPASLEGARDSLTVDEVVTADLDGDGYPEFVSTVLGETATDGLISSARSVPHITWGGPGGSKDEGAGAKGEATPVQLPPSVSKLGVQSLVRGDFDGDGHHDLAALAQNEQSTVVLYGPFTRDGNPARSDTGLPGSSGALIADAVDPSGKPRPTSLLVQGPNDGEQSANTFHRARKGTGLAADAKELRVGSAHAFGDFDGDGTRDVAVGDNGGRNNEPGYDKEDPDVDGSLSVYPGSGGAPVTHRLPEAPKGAATDYGPGGFTAADPDGDGRDGILVATYEGATLFDGERRVPVLRQGPARVDGKGRKAPATWRHARPVGAGDFDGDGRDELVLNWSSDSLFALYGENPTHWWITRGTTDKDQASFLTTGFAGESAR